LVLRDNELKKQADCDSDKTAQDAVMEGEENNRGAILGSKAADNLLSRVKSIPVAYEELRKVNLDLVAIFTEHYGPSAILEKREVPAAY
jgi:hypothetical protein